MQVNVQPIPRQKKKKGRERKKNSNKNKSGIDRANIGQSHLSVLFLVLPIHSNQVMRVHAKRIDLVDSDQRCQIITNVFFFFSFLFFAFERRMRMDD